MSDQRLKPNSAVGHKRGDKHPMAIPTANPTTGSGAEDAANRIAITLSGSDVDGALNHFTIATLPTNGQLFDAAVGGNPLSANSTISANADQAIVYFQPAGNFNGANSFTYTASQGGQNSPPATASITVTSVNDEPAGPPIVSRGILEDQAYTFSAADFALTDANDNPANTLSAVVITTLPVGTGVLKLSGVDVTAGQ